MPRPKLRSEYEYEDCTAVQREPHRSGDFFSNQNEQERGGSETFVWKVSGQPDANHKKRCATGDSLSPGTSITSSSPSIMIDSKLQKLESKRYFTEMGRSTLVYSRECRCHPLR